VYYDGQMNDSQLNVAIACTAALVGAVVLNHAEAISLKKDEVTGNVTGIFVTPDLVHTQLSDAVQQVLMRKVLLPACRNILCTSLISIAMPSHY
jgi:glycerol-3-phosphate dehydrogenase